MDAEQFLNEVLTCSERPDGFEQTYKRFQEIQSLVMSTLNEFHRVCELNGVEYFLAYGSLLGAIRDGGQIPWDYDVDVLLRISDRDVLIQALKKDLGDNFYFVTSAVDPSCRHEMIRVAPKGYKSEIIHVDVFLLAGLPENKEERMKMENQFQFLQKARYLKKMSIKDEWRNSYKRLLMILGGKILFAPIPMAYVDRKFLELAFKYPIDKSSFCCTADGFATTTEYPTEWLRGSELIQTSQGQFRIAEHYLDFLKKDYGNYMEIPSRKSRIRSVMNSIEHFDFLNK